MKTFRQSLQSADFTITAELSLRHETGARELIRQAEKLRDSVTAIQIAENPHSRVQMSAVAAAGLLANNGFDVIPRLHCRDRNRIALQSDLLGLRAMGVNSLVLTRGKQLPDGNKLRAKPVFDLSCRELVAMANAMNDEETTRPENEFLIGTDTRVIRPRPGWKGESLLGRASAGAQFLQTGICFDINLLRQYMAMLVEARITWNYSVIVSLAPLPSADSARWLMENTRDCLIPEALIARLDSAEDPEAEGVAICAELMRLIATIPGISGVNLLTPGNPECVVAAVCESGL